jgi:hypothetical protein
MPKYQSETPMAAVPPIVAPKFNLHTPQAAIQVPLGQALAAGILAGVSFLAWALLITSPSVWSGALVCTVTVIDVVFVISQWRWFVLTAEKITGTDINQDGQVGEEEEVTRIDITQIVDGKPKSDELKIPCKPEKFLRLAIGIVNRRLPFTGDEWGGKGKVFSDPQFRKLRSYLITKRFIVQSSAQGPNPGYVFNRNGIAMLRDYMQQHGYDPTEFDS